MHKRKRIKKLESRLMFTTAAKQAIVEKKNRMDFTNYQKLWI